MRKLFALVILVALVFSASDIFAAVGYEKEGEHIGQATDINIQGNSTFDGSVLTIIANGHKDGVTTNVSNESNILAAQLAYGVIDRTELACNDVRNHSVALANGSKGQMVTLLLSATTSGVWLITDDQVSSGVFTMTKTGWDDIALNSALDTVTLLYVDDTYGWIIVGQYGVTVT